MKPYQIIKGLRLPSVRAARREGLNTLINLALKLQPGEAVVLKLSEANQMRTILAAQGFACQSDAWRCELPGHMLVFKVKAR